jgi:hypothetical protein
LTVIVVLTAVVGAGVFLYAKLVAYRQAGEMRARLAQAEWVRAGAHFARAQRELGEGEASKVQRRTELLRASELVLDSSRSMSSMIANQLVDLVRLRLGLDRTRPARPDAQRCHAALRMAAGFLPREMREERLDEWLDELEAAQAAGRPVRRRTASIVVRAAPHEIWRLRVRSLKRRRNA